MKKLYGEGTFDVDYICQKFETTFENGVRKTKRVWKCPFYAKWQGMLHRCYYQKYLERFPIYSRCTVCDEWLRFSNFKAWMETQDWEGKVLDKDLLVFGNTVYSPDTCCFLDEKINNFLVGRKLKESRGKLLGAKYHKRDEVWESSISNPLSGKREYLGRFPTEKEAHLAWVYRKIEFSKLLAATDLVGDDIKTADALISYYHNYL